MATVLIRCQGNNSPRYDGKLFYEPVNTIVKVNGAEVHGIAVAELKPGDSVTIKRGKGARLWNGIVADPVEASPPVSAAVEAASLASLSSSSTITVSSDGQRKK